MMQDNTPADETTIRVAIPEGYIALPLQGIDDSISAATSLFEQLGPGGVSDAAPAVLRTLRTFLTRLSSLNVAYCGLGKHRSSDGRTMTSTLVITASRYGEQRNPRLTLADYLSAKEGSAGCLNVEIIEISGNTILISDRVTRMPSPEFPTSGSEPDEPTETEVYQIEAVVPSRDGSRIAVVELSTTFVESGEEYVPVVAALAGTIEFIAAPNPHLGKSLLGI
ncbi:hypothetical protein [Nocardia transvalensis]|uniref:hypothetical protein n=1 Tax=Nocardia transvalensis TaxID=37333 RepID=UPI001895C615|nr:hypothetical protein [Nocardia transvalensis]MBF6327447.1 hypothetical protein [Nocardia transvalensis]